jgi:FkbM family methyltransferase
MTNEAREHIITTILEHEKLRPLSRLHRLLRKPLQTFPYYILAGLSHIKPFPLTFTTLWGTKMTSYLPEGNTFYYYGCCEANLTNFFLRYLHSGMTVLDIGAHVGIYSMLASELVEATGKVHSFEPTPSTFTLLNKNTEQLGNVVTNNIAVSSSERTLTFSDYGAGYSAYNSASSSGGQGIHKHARTLSVQSTTIDAYCTKNELQPDLIKIDAEGFESEVLQGGQKLFSVQTSLVRPLITLEVAGEKEWAKNRQDSFAFLEKNNYLPFTILTDGTILPHTLKDSYRYDNLLFIPKERIAETQHILI